MPDVWTPPRSLIMNSIIDRICLLSPGMSWASFWTVKSQNILLGDVPCRKVFPDTGGIHKWYICIDRFALRIGNKVADTAFAMPSLPIGLQRGNDLWIILIYHQLHRINKNRKLRLRTGSIVPELNQVSIIRIIWCFSTFKSRTPRLSQFDPVCTMSISFTLSDVSNVVCECPPTIKSNPGTFIARIESSSTPWCVRATSKSVFGFSSATSRFIVSIVGSIWYLHCFFDSRGYRSRRTWCR